MTDDPGWKLRLPRGPSVSPALAIARRLAIALGVILVNWLLVVIERDGYRDAQDGKVSLIDALYYTTVTLSTTGYGDITPVTSDARLTNALLVTPMRFLFLFVLVGTTIEVLTERSRDQFRVARWRSRVKDHVVVCGFGTKGRSAVRALLLSGTRRDHIVVVENSQEGVEAATASGYVVVHGSSTSDSVLREAEVGKARAVIVAVNRDDSAVLTTLTVRQLAPQVNIVAAVREAENADLLTQGGADSVITSSDAAGRLLGLATESPATVALVEDLIAFGNGLDLMERAISSDEVGQSPRNFPAPVLAVVRGGATLPYDEPSVQSLRAGDRVIFVCTPRSRQP